MCPGSSTCVVDQTNNAYCVTCNRICPEVTSPDQYLCGNDGIVYASACHLRRATCLLGRSIGVAYEGKCISECQHKFCLFHLNEKSWKWRNGGICFQFRVHRQQWRNLKWIPLVPLVFRDNLNCESHWRLIVSWCWQPSSGVITNCAWLAYSSPQQEQTRLWISTYETLKCYQKKLTAIVSYCLFRGQVMWRYPVQRGEEVSMGFQDGSRALCSLHGEVPRKSIGGGRVRQRQHHVSQRVRHEAGRLLFGGSPGG